MWKRLKFWGRQREIDELTAEVIWLRARVVALLALVDQYREERINELRRSGRTLEHPRIH